MDVAHEESTAALKKINAAKAQFLALKRANSGLEPSAPRAKISSRMVEVHATAVDPEGDADAPNPGSASGQADARGGDRENGRGGRSKRRGNGRGGDVLEVKTNDRNRAARLVPSPTARIHTRTTQKWTSPGGGNSSKKTVSAPFAFGRLSLPSAILCFVGVQNAKVCTTAPYITRSCPRRTWKKLQCR